MEYTQLRIERDGAVAVCTISNPPHGYMDRVTVEELDAFTAEVADDEAVGAVVFRGGVPGVFIQHYSVHELEALARRLRERGTTFDPGIAIPERQIDRVFARLSDMPRLTVAAINGNAMGGGFEFCLSCDIRVAEDGDFSLGLPEVNVGILPGAGGTQRLARLVGTARALELILQGRTVNPAEAARLGMVHELTPPGGAYRRAMQIAQRVASRPRLAVAHTKRLIRMAATTPLDEGLAQERALFLDLLIRDEALQLMQEMNRGERGIRD
jgi:enoyl-CoA hydratase